MNAGPQSIVSLLTSANQRMVIPVYQRAYSWDEEQCRQLWDDIVAVGRRSSGTHFTGSVVMVLGGEFSASGVNKLLIIDGQQRITTLSLLIAAMAEYAREQPEKLTHVSYEEIIDSGYLVLKYKKGEDHYRLTLSQGDERTLRSVLDHLENPDVKVASESHRIVDNLALFRTWLNNIDDSNVVWDGIQRLEIVAITLSQGQDNPQLIFESMNSTGKDLSTADLVRNFVLMGLPMDEQENLYANYWRTIEETLGADSYDEVFDEFLRNWLTVINAPASIATRDVYRLFKRHVTDNGYDKPGQMANLLKEIRRYAEHYACIASGACEDEELRVLLARIRALDVTVVNPLLMSLFEDYRDGALSHEDFSSILRTTESYLFRRAACDVATNSLNKFFSSVIARLATVREDGGDIREAFEAILLGEEGTARRMPSDAEFERALKTRDCYAFKRGFHLLTTLENSYHTKDPLDFSGGAFTIEHIMPQNALASAEWRDALGPDCERIHEELVNTLGNLTLTAYNPELSDASFVEKKTHLKGGFDKDYLVISKELHEAEAWDEGAIRERAERLADRALEVWPRPELSAEVVASYKPAKKTVPAMRPMTFREVCSAASIVPGTVLFASDAGRAIVAEVTDGYGIRLSNGEVLESPSRAATRVKELATGKRYAVNGWKFWHVGEDGPLLSDVRAGCLLRTESLDLKAAFWAGFYDYCAERPDYVGAYTDPSDRVENKGWYATFGLGRRGAHATAYFVPRDSWIGVDLWFTDVSLYERLVVLRREVEALFADLGGKISWREPGEKTRELQVRLDADVSSEHWDELFAWLVKGLLRMRAAAKMLRVESDDAADGDQSDNDKLHESSETGNREPAKQLGESDFDEPGILIKISNVSLSEMSAQELYDRVRGNWRVSFMRARNAKLAFGVFDGRIVEVYCIDEWLPVGQGEVAEPEGGRYQFVGHLASNELRERYNGQLVASLSRGQNPIRYVGGA